ncbi:MAG: RNA 3'-phosphate cyclase [Candidatus Heimdallarchaeota archaeon]|nr:RNA 3'-phosphate cyclase [Candidatus Heimdallarchaeota archaeon]
MSAVLDCSIGEGGGSIVRIATALAAATNSPLKLVNIRSNRPNPGLRSQHLEAINALRQLSGFEVVGANLGSKELSFDKYGKRRNDATVKINTAGSISLVAQAVQYYALNNGSQIILNIQGGATHGKWAPSVEFVENVTFKILEKMNKLITVDINQYGYYPKGGAQSRFIFKPHNKIIPLDLTEKGTLEEISVFSTVSSHLRKRNVAERQLETFAKLTKQPEKIVPHINYVNSNSPGTGLTIVNKYSTGAIKGCFTPGEKSITAEQVGEMCWEKWKDLENNGAAVDSFTADQLIVAMALAEGNSTITVDSLTNHTKTNIDLIQKFISVTINVKKRNGYYHVTIKPH